MFLIVTGEANFSMQTTSLTVGGFNQPSVARSLIELPGNAEKGLSQRFLWFFPKPVYGQFDTLEPINKNFVEKLGIYHDIKFKRDVNLLLYIFLCSETFIRVVEKDTYGQTT